jgi:uncharacterized protein YidB (DUF937 family)
MIDQLIKLVEKNAGDAIVNNQAIPNQFNNDAIQDVAQQILGGLKGQVSSGNYAQVLSMFQGEKTALASNPLVSQMISNIVGDFATKFGVSRQAAQSAVSSLLPQVLNQLVSKTNDPADNDFDLQDMLRNFSGNKNLNMSDLLGSVVGNSSSGGGVGDVLGKIFK